MSIKCSKCGTINKDAAKYCARCGTELSNNIFVLEKFPEIKFKVASKYAKMWDTTDSLAWGYIVYFLIGLLVGPIFLIFEPYGDERSDFMDVINTVNIFIWIGLAAFLLFLFMLSVLRVMKKDNSEFIKQQCSLMEKGLKKRYIRVYKDEKLGIVDRMLSKIILNINYDNIKHLKRNMFMIEQYGKCGLFNAHLCKIIIPVGYEKIDIYDHNIFSAFDGYNTDYFNADGDKL